MPAKALPMSATAAENSWLASTHSTLVRRVAIWLGVIWPVASICWTCWGVRAVEANWL